MTVDCLLASKPLMHLKSIAVLALTGLVLGSGFVVTPAAPAGATEPVEYVDVDKTHVSGDSTWPWHDERSQVSLTLPGCMVSVNAEILIDNEWVMPDYPAQTLWGGEGLNQEDCTVTHGRLDMAYVLANLLGVSYWAIPGGEYTVRFVSPPGTRKFGPGVRDEFGVWHWDYLQFAGAKSEAVTVSYTRAGESVGEFEMSDWNQTQLYSVKGNSPYVDAVAITVPDRLPFEVYLESRSPSGDEWTVVKRYSFNDGLSGTGTFEHTLSISFPVLTESKEWRLRIPERQLSREYVSEILQSTVFEYDIEVEADRVTSWDPGSLAVPKPGEEAIVVLRIDPHISGEAYIGCPFDYSESPHVSYRLVTSPSVMVENGTARIRIGAEQFWRAGYGAFECFVAFDPVNVDSQTIFEFSERFELTHFRAPLVGEMGQVPSITGSTVVGEVLTAGPGTWVANVSLTYEWLRDGEVIAGVTESSYSLRVEDLGAKISVRVTGAKSGYVSVTNTSGETSAVLGPPPVNGAAVAKDPFGNGVNGVKVNIRKGGCDVSGPGVWENTTATSQWSTGGFGVSLEPGTYCVTTLSAPNEYVVPTPFEVSYGAASPWVTVWLSPNPDAPKPAVNGAAVAKDPLGNGVNGVKVNIRKGGCDVSGPGVWENTTATSQWSTGGFGVSLEPGTYCVTTLSAPNEYVVPTPFEVSYGAASPWVTVWLSPVSR